MKNFLFALSLILSITACKQEDKKETILEIDLPPINEVFESYYQQSLKLNPINATFAGDNRFNDKLPNNITKNYKETALNVFQTYKDSLELYDDTYLNDEEKLSKAVLLWELDQNINLLKFKTHLMPLNQFSAMHLTIGQLGSGSSAQPFKTISDYDNWLSRLDKFSVWIDSAIVNMKKGVEEGYVLPNSLILKTIPQIKDLTKTPVEENLFFAPVKMIPENFTKEEKSHVTSSYTQTIKDKVIPVMDRLNTYLNDQYLKAGRTSSGISDIPEGKELYNALIKQYTTTNMTADEIHQLGLSEVARIKSEMEKIKKEVGFNGDLNAFFDQVRNKKELMPYNQPQQVIDHFNEIHEKMKPNLITLFDLTPKTAFEVRRTEAFREASASAEYNPGTLDGTRPGIFYVPIPNVEKYNIYSDEDLFLHEAIPGHHYQISLQQENEELPDFRKTLWYSAYGEGWALYAESLGKELGLYNDPYQYFGMLSAEMHRAIRLVVDTGIHAKGWSREKAIQYSLDNEAESEASIIAEIERYMAIPGQALSYKVGQLKILALRQKAEKELGDKFDIKQFHNKILESGCIPLKLLEDKINQWITTQK
ncbi:DUF885 domain-containing protein [Zhouia amylolytica]|uniref:DUF885 domain-containing protein n=1 Tax=Zhouia amylolytica TaxID=376730 RepID=UPI0020CDC0C2|nr:DUF885 domain-containing protein [Zhouia amylolytica]MCQ0110181.1 DUF885 domain-containing protein [Zhouia amylolytica]